AVNILGTLTLSRFFTNESLVQIDPTIISSSGLILIIVWGLAFIATSNYYKKNRWIVGVFALEKTTYVAMWCYWYFTKDYTLKSLFDLDFMTGFFYATFGLNDLLFLCFFCYVFFKKLDQ
ncbi:MAG: hypothetical protein VXW95_05390, partial [Bacteroidota bacterium]|nr:hypothetical protein [Bacteroidota bacterium]